MSKEPRIPSGFKVRPLTLQAFEPTSLARYRELHPEETTVTTACDLRSPLGAVETASGWIDVNQEGVIGIKPLSDKHPWAIELYAHAPGYIGLMPWATLKLRPAELTSVLTLKEVPLEDWIRTFGSRLEENYHTCVQHLTKLNRKKA